MTNKLQEILEKRQAEKQAAKAASNAAIDAVLLALHAMIVTGTTPDLGPVQDALSAGHITDEFVENARRDLEIYRAELELSQTIDARKAELRQAENKWGEFQKRTVCERDKLSSARTLASNRFNQAQKSLQKIHDLMNDKSSGLRRAVELAVDAEVSKPKPKRRQAKKQLADA